MENQGDVDPQALAGAISTATHGTGGRFGNLSSQVTAVRLVTARGTLMDIREGDELRAARVSLGALGAISAVTLRCVPAFTIHRIDEPRPLDDVLAGSTSTWIPTTTGRLRDAYTRKALTLTSERTDLPRARPGVRRRSFATWSWRTPCWASSAGSDRRFPG